MKKDMKKTKKPIKVLLTTYINGVKKVVSGDSLESAKAKIKKLKK